MTEQEQKWKEGILKNGLRDYDYLADLPISFRTYTGGDHAHCELCWDRISMDGADLHDGYRSDDGKIWLCRDCVSSFRQLFRWRISDEP